MNRALFFTFSLVFLAVLSSAASASDKTSLDVAHWWTSEGEAKAIAVVQAAFEKQGYGWVDASIEGGGGDTLTARLRAMVAEGSPPAAVQVFMGPNLRGWAEEGLLIDLSDVAKAGRWADVLPPIINDMIQYEGKYVGAPINAHRANSMWVNADVLKAANAQPPATWDEFLVVAKKIQDAGYIPLALGGQAWQEATLFESIVLGMGGLEFHRKAFIELDQEALGGEQMVRCFAMLRKVLQFVDPDFPNRDWDVATKMVMDGKAGIQIMGDWAKGEFLSGGETPDQDFFCLAAPGTAGLFLIVTDTIAMFKTPSPKIIAAQKDLAKTIMNPIVQKQFNIIKGSIPARMDIGCADFDACACASMDVFQKAARSNAIAPSMAYSQAYDREMTELMTGLVGAFTHSDMLPEQAAQKMAALALSAM